MKTNKLRMILVGLAVLALACSAVAGDWPAYKHDPARSGVTADALRFPLAKKWLYRPNQPPMPAWPEPGKELHRMDFDYAFQPVVTGGLVYFASSADDTVRAVEATTGELVWRFTTDGPIRFAPHAALGRLYVASDDGWLYCLDGKTGKLVWRFHGAPGDDRIIGNGRMISRWPCRSGVLVADGVVYFTAGMWPTEGVYIYALDAKTGKELWCNDSSGSLYVDLPHPGATGFSGVAPQGYLLAHEDKLLVATGRCVPAAFDRRTGRLLYYKPAVALYHGGAWITSGGGLYFNPKNRFQNPSEAFVGEAQPVQGDGMFAYSFASGNVEFAVGHKYRVLASGDVLYAVGDGTVQAMDLKGLWKNRGFAPKLARWTTPHPNRVYCIALAGRTLLTGEAGAITAFDAETGKVVWSTKVEGQVRGLAVADGRLVASTRNGAVLCFEHAPAGRMMSRDVVEKKVPPDIPPEQERAAEDIVEKAGKTQGYAIVIGEPDSRLAEAIAARTELRVVNVLHGGADPAAERERLLESGLCGSRVSVLRADDPTRLPCASYFADLVVVSGRAKGVSARECYRVLRPCGGALCFVGLDRDEKRKFIEDAAVPRGEVAEGTDMVVRGPLPGAGEWRYPWADGGRTGVGKESRVRFPLGLLWFGGPGPDRLMDRHWMTSPPVSANGRVFMTGQHDVIAFDAYNGRELWSRHIENVGRKYSQYYSSALVADDDSVYVVKADRCYCLDQATGKTVSVYAVPESVVKSTPPPRVGKYMDVEWPRMWRVIGPFPKGNPPLPPSDLKAVPERVTVAGKEYAAVPLEAEDDIIDFTVLYGGYGFKPLPPGAKAARHPRRGSKFSYTDTGRICYAFAKINCPKAGKLLIGAGGDWWMQWFLDGKPVFDTLNGGNHPSYYNYFSKEVVSPTDYVFEADVTPGEHVLAVMVKSGSRGWALASASMAAKAKDVMPVLTGQDPNLPDLRSMIWGYVSVTDDLVLGSYNVPVTAGQPQESQLVWRSESKAVFALDKEDGSLRWVYRPKGDRVVSNIEIAFGDGRLFLVDGTSKADSIRARRRGEKIEIKLTLVALDLSDGSELWRQDDVPALAERSQPTRLKSNPSHLFMGLPCWEHLVYANGLVVLGANAAYDAATGKVLWRKTARPQKLPIILGDWLIVHPRAYELRTGRERTTRDILTGEEVSWRYGRAYGCGPVNGCRNLLFFRSGADGFFDLEADGTTNFGGVRPNCSRSILAANGLLIHPEGYSGCCCSYNYQTCLALAHMPDRRGTWYVFPRRASTGRIKRIALNFGAPGDRRDDRGMPWLGFPRPMTTDACLAPVTVLMGSAECYRRWRDAASIKGTDSSWLYASGLRGRGRISIGLVLQPNLAVPTCGAAPEIDGKLDDPCWKEAGLAAFENTAFTMLGANVELRVFRDADNLYFGYHRKPLPNPPRDADEALLGRSDALDIFITDLRRIKSRKGIHISVKRNGNAFARCGSVGRLRKVDPTWKDDWRCAVAQTPEEWTAEVVVPLATLTRAGINVNALQLNCMSRNLTGAGLEAIFLVDPVFGADFKRCSRFRRVIEPPAQPPEERAYTVRLHFAELNDVQPGGRVFDVAIQGRVVLKDFDIVRAAGGRRVAVVKEFRGVKARDELTIELTPSKGGTKAPPAISAIEIVEET